MSGLNSFHVKTGYIEQFLQYENLLLLEIPTDIKPCGEYACQNLTYMYALALNANMFLSPNHRNG